MGIAVGELLGIKDSMSKRVGGASVHMTNLKEIFTAIAALLFLLECEGIMFFLRKINSLEKASS